MKKLIGFICCCFLFATFSVAKASVYLDVPWQCQLDPDEGLGTIWDNSMTCGPTSLVMAAHYLRNFRDPNAQDVKNLIDWLYENKLVSAINNYDLVYGEGTSYGDLMAAAAYYYGLWNIHHYNVNDLNLLRDSLLANKPVIIGVQTQMVGAAHWMLLVGMDDSYVYVNDPGRGTESLGKGAQYSISTFQASWATQNYASIIFEDNNEVGEYSDGWHDGGVVENISPQSQPFVDFYLNTGTVDVRGPDYYGYPYDTIHTFALSNLWTQYYPDGDYLFILNKNIYVSGRSYLGAVFSVHGRIKDYWEYNYLSLGPPTTNEYYYPEGTTNNVVQWFEPSAGQYIALVYDNVNGSYAEYSPGETGCPPWDQEFFIQSIENNTGYEDDGYGMGGGTDPIDPPTSPYYDLFRTTTAEGITKNPVTGEFIYPYDPVNETSYFLTSEIDYAFSWMQLNNLSKRVRVDWYWYDSNNNIVRTYYDWYGSDSGTYEWYKVWDRLPIFNVNNFGLYKVEIYIDEELAVIDEFTVTVNVDFPTDLTIQSVSASTVNFTWTGDVDANSYRVYRDGYLVAETQETSFNDTGLSPETSYAFRVLAIRGNIASPLSNELNVTTGEEYSYTSYFDGEDETVGNWTVVSGIATIASYYDAQADDHLLEFQGTDPGDTFSLNLGGNDKQFILYWEQQFSYDYTLLVKLQTDSGVRYIRYYGKDTTIVYKDDPLIALGANSKNGTRQIFQRNIKEDFAILFPSETITAVYELLVKTDSGYIDDVRLMAIPSVYFDGEDGTVGGWSVVNGVASIATYYDSQEDDYLLEFQGTDPSDTFHLDLGNNDKQFILCWEHQFSNDFTFLVNLQTASGERYIRYYGKDTTMVYKDDPLIALGGGAKDGTRQTFQRNIKEDFAILFPDETVISVKEIYVKTDSGYIDDVILK